MKAFKLPHDLMLGSATASLQIEGGDRNNSWYRFSEEKRIKDGSHCIVAADHWNRVEEDVAIMKSLHHQTYRMSLEWSRIEPQLGEFNFDAIEHYRDEIIQLLESGIHPLVTLHHFSNPLWLEDIGGWLNPNVVDYFSRYTEVVVNELGHLVSDWVTINEPNVYLYQAYIELNAPPARSSITSFFKGMRNMIAAHIEAYKIIHRIREESNFKGETLVGVANHLRVFDVEKKPKRSSFSSKLTQYTFHTLFLEGMIHGKYLFPIGTDRLADKSKIYCDFLGVNYYSRDIVEFTWSPLMVFAKLLVKEGMITNEMGWEIYPEGLYRVCKEYYERYQLPIFITENGICDSTDALRPQFIYDHLLQVARLREENIPVMRYYHWSTIDNFEWLEGLSKRFGLVHVDYETQKRTVRNSGHFYGEICRDKEVSTEMIEKYLQSK